MASRCNSQVRKTIHAKYISTPSALTFHTIRASDTTPYLEAGHIGYDPSTKRLYYTNDTEWVQLKGISSSIASSRGNFDGIASYTLILAADASVVYNTDTILGPWLVASDHISDPGDWDVATGAYKAVHPHVLTVNALIAWKEGISNLGIRTLYIDHERNGGVTTVKTVSGQAEPFLDVETTQEISVHVTLAAGDSLALKAYHTAPVTLQIKGGVSTNVSGLSIY